MPSLDEIGSVVLEKKIFFFVNVFSLFLNYLPLEKGKALHLYKLESPLPKDALCLVLVEISPVVLEKKMKMFTDRRTDRQTDRRRTKGDQKSSLELSAQVS